jgi:hypothetical protein
MEPEGSIPNSQALSACSYPEPDQSSPTFPRSILILSTHLRLGFRSGLFPSGFPTNNLYMFLFPPILRFSTAGEKREGFGPNGSKHYRNSKSS